MMNAAVGMPAGTRAIGKMLTVATLNILNDLTYWHERAPLIVEGFRALQPDLIALQEVTLSSNNAQWIADQLGGYEVRLCPQTGGRRNKEGIAVLSRLPIVRGAVLDLGSQHRVAQYVQIDAAGRPLVFVNTHLYWRPGESRERVKQVERLQQWLDDIAPDAAIAVCGDFNGTPDSTAITLMRERFASAYSLRHAREPDYTCPTPLIEARSLTLRSVRQQLRQAILNLLFNHTLRQWQGTLDYIFVSRNLQVQACEVILNRPSSNNDWLYASDHFGLMAQLHWRQSE